MKILIRLAIIIVSILQGWNLPASAFSITSPKDGDVFHVGDTVVVTAETSSGELIHTVYFKSSITGLLAEVAGAFNKIEGPPFQTEFKIPSNFDISNPIKLFALGVRGQSPNKEEIEAVPITIRVTLSSGVKLTSIEVDPRQGFLYLEPQLGRSKQLSVAGLFSDGIRRSIKGASFGNTYRSSNEKIVTVDSEGVMKAIGVGKAFITVRNGDKSAQIEVEVAAKP